MPKPTPNTPADPIAAARAQVAADRRRRDRRALDLAAAGIAASRKPAR